MVKEVSRRVMCFINGGPFHVQPISNCLLNTVCTSRAMHLNMYEIKKGPNQLSYYKYVKEQI